MEGSGPNEITDSLDAIVSNAKERIWIAVPWFYTDGSMISYAGYVTLQNKELTSDYSCALISAIT